ncbi:MAG: thioesterase family protein [Bacteroidota bacterium]|nr:thioesterase family protein [Bacteroidota bacterium]
MFTHKTQIRIHYALTDQMGVVYHGHYAQFYEIGRTEALRSLGLTYKEIESTGVLMLVTEIHSRFLRPAKYDDLITVITSIKEMPVHHKITFHSEIYNEENKLLNAGDVSLYFVDAKTMKRCEMPLSIKEMLVEYYN